MKFPTIWYVRPTKAQTSLHVCATDQSLGLSVAYSKIIKLLTEHHFEFLILIEGFTGSSVSALVTLLAITCRGSARFSLETSVVETHILLKKNHTKFDSCTCTLL